MKQRLALLTALALGCGATVDGSRNTDAGTTPQDAPALPQDAPSPPRDASPPGCRWTPTGPLRVLRSGGGAVLLAEAIATDSGAAVTVLDGDALRLLRVGSDGAPDPAQPTPIPLTTGPSPAVVNHLSMAWIAAPPRVEVLWEDPTAQAFCVWSQVDAAGARTRAVMLDPMGIGFSLTGCRDLAVIDGARSFVSEQVRATWGHTLLALDDTGRATQRAVLPMTAGPPSAPLRRVALPDGGALLWWTQVSSPRALLAQRVGPAGDALDVAHTVRAAMGETDDAQVVVTDEGPMALWTEISPPSMLPTRWAQPLTAMGAPQGPPIPWSALGTPVATAHATARGPEVVTATVVGSGVLRVVIQGWDARGVARGEAGQLSQETTPLPIHRVRVVATPAGALVFVDGRLSSGEGGVVAVPIACR